jgi:hypothetical protein
MIRSVALVLFLFSLLYAPVTASAFEARLEPRLIKQGDPFFLRVISGEGGEGGEGTGMDIPRAELNGKEFPFGGCGKGCFVAVASMPVDAEPGEYAIEVSVGESGKALALTVEEGSFPLQELTLPEGKVTLSPEDAKRANLESAKLRALWPRKGERLWEGSFIMPLENSHSTRFGTRRIMNGRKKSVHSGLDIRGGMGEEVRAANSGRVALAEEQFFGGNTLVLDHGQGIYTIYMHLSGFNAAPGQPVSRGEVIGFVGSTGRSTGPHLHYGVKINAVNTNPVSLTKLPLPAFEGAKAPAEEALAGDGEGLGGTEGGRRVAQ